MMYLNFLLLGEHSEKEIVDLISSILRVKSSNIINYLKSYGTSSREVEYSYIQDEKEQFKTIIELWIENHLVKDKHPIRLILEINEKIKDYVLIDFNGLKDSDGLLLISPLNQLYETDIEEPPANYEGTNWIDFSAIDPLLNISIP